MIFDRNVHFHSFMFSIQSILKQAPLFSCSFPPPWVHLLTFLKCLFIVILCAKYLSKPFENTGKIKYIFLKYNNVWYMFFVCSFALCFFFFGSKENHRMSLYPLYLFLNYLFSYTCRNICHNSATIYQLNRKY